MDPCSTLREARQAAGLTFREVGQASGLPLTAIAHYERGARTPGPASLARWRDGLKQLMAARAAKIVDVLVRF